MHLNNSHLILRYKKVRWIKYVFLAALFFVAEHDLYFSLGGSFISPTEIIVNKSLEGSLQRRIVFSLLGLFGIVGLLRRRKKRIKINGAIGWLFLLYFLWASLSLVWADDFNFTLRRLMIFWMFCIGGLAAGKHFSIQEIIKWVFFTTGVLLIVGIACEIFLGTFRPFAFGYRFAGTFHPNSQGVNCFLLLIAGLALGKAAKRGRWFFILCAIFGLIFLILSGSRTAFASGVTALIFTWVIISKISKKLIPIFVICIGFCFLALFVGKDIFPSLQQGIMLGRTQRSNDVASFTGRIPLWKVGLDYAAIRPIQGYGYNGFLTPSRIAEIANIHGWGVFQIHSAYLELILGTGLVGMTFFVMILFFSVTKSISRFKVSLNPGYACFISFFVFSLLEGILESLIVSSTMYAFVAIVFLAHLEVSISPIPYRSGFVRRR